MVVKVTVDWNFEFLIPEYIFERKLSLSSEKIPGCNLEGYCQGEIFQPSGYFCYTRYMNFVDHFRFDVNLERRKVLIYSVNMMQNQSEE